MFRQRKRLMICTALFVLNVFLLICYRQSTMKHEQGDKPNKRIEEAVVATEFNDQKCKVPQLNPYHPEVLPFISTSDVKPCDIKQYGEVDGDVLHLKMKNVQSVWLYYVTRVDDFHVKFSNKHVVFGSTDDKTGEPCWEECGSKGGLCSYCGKKGYCCRQGFDDCPLHLGMMAKQDYHSCVYSVIDKVPENFDMECWTSCGSQTGACSSFCGHGGYCCRKGHPGCPQNVLHTNSHHHACTVFLNGSLPGKPVPGMHKTQGDVHIKYRVKEDFFKLDILVDGRHHEEYHAAFTNLSTIQEKKHQLGSNDANILMVMFDSVSKANAERQWKNTVKYLNELPNTHIMKGLSIVGDGTTAQLCAMFTGTPEDELPEARRSVAKGTFVDRWPFIFNDLHRAGYTTMYSEDSPWGSTFQYRLHGFKKIPTTKYLRPWWQAMDELIAKSSELCSVTISLDYTKRFFKAYEKYKKFAFVLSSTISHNSLNTVGVADNYLPDFYRYLREEGILDNTVVILFGDHGCRAGKFRSSIQGKLEERLPFMAFTLPPYFNDQPKLLNYFKENINLLTSHFDIHATLQHIMSWPHGNKKTEIKYGKSLFSDIKSLNRTCADAGIEPHWCPCLDFEVVNVSKDTIVHKLARDAINQINKKIKTYAPGKCEPLSIDHIIRAGRRKPNLDVLEFSHSLVNRRCDSCGVKREKNGVVRFIYEVNFAVSPSGGEFEINRETTYDSNSETLNVVETDQISRTNIYGNAPHCLDPHQRHLEKYCFCKGFRYPT